MKENTAKAEAERLLQAELRSLVAQVKSTIDKEEAALARIRQVLQELDALNEKPAENPDQSPEGGTSVPPS